MENEYTLDEDATDRIAYRQAEFERLEHEKRRREEPMGDVYDVYAKAVGVHSTISDMTEDYTLTRYNIDIYNTKFPKFVREQRKLLRIIKSFIIIPKETLRLHYNNEDKVEKIYDGLCKEYKIIEDLLIGELDECVIMGRTPEGEVIKAFLQYGMMPENRDDYNSGIERPNTKNKLMEKTKQ